MLSTLNINGVWAPIRESEFEEFLLVNHFYWAVDGTCKLNFNAYEAAYIQGCDDFATQELMLENQLCRYLTWSSLYPCCLSEIHARIAKIAPLLVSSFSCKLICRVCSYMNCIYINVYIHFLTRNLGNLYHNSM